MAKNWLILTEYILLLKSQLHAAFTMTETKYCMEMTNLQEIRLLNSINSILILEGVYKYKV